MELSDDTWPGKSTRELINLNFTMNRKEAFTAVINQRGVHHRLGLSSAQVRQYRHQLKTGKVTDDTMRSVLEHYGAELKQEEIWEIS